MARRIDNKQDMYELLKAGTLGNAFRTWPSIAAAEADNYHGPFGARTSIKDGPGFRGDMHIREARRIEKAYADTTFLAFCEYVPNHLITMSAECQRNGLGLYLRYREGPGHMREAMANCRHAWNMEAYQIICRHGGLSLYGWLSHLMQEYDGPQASESATVEFATFSTYVGPEQRNYVIWEVRSY